MKITNLRQQKRRRDRVSVFLDEEFWIGITERLCNELNLFVGMEISEEQKSEIENGALEDGALQYAFDRLSARLLPTRDLRDRLLQREYSPTTVDGVIDRCQELGLLDDELWAETVAEERAARGQGKKRAALVLQQGGIENEMAQRILAEVFPEDEELQAAREVLEQRYRGPLHPGDQRRAWNLLLRRGFAPEAARAAVQERAMTPLEEEEHYGWEEALELLQRRFREPVAKNKARDFLLRRSFSPAATDKALRSFDRLIS